MFNPYVILIAAGVFIASVTGAYFKGHSDADQRARVAELQAALNGAYQDLDAQRVAAEAHRKTAEDNRRAAEQAERIADEYEAELRKRGDAVRCVIGDDDLIRLRKYGHGSDQNAPRR